MRIKNIKTDRKGVTLMELLAYIVLYSLFVVSMGSMMYTAFFMMGSMNYISGVQVPIHNKMNYVTMQINEYLNTKDQYSSTISVSDNEIIIYLTADTYSGLEDISYTYSIDNNSLLDSNGESINNLYFESGSFTCRVVGSSDDCNTISDISDYSNAIIIEFDFVIKTNSESSKSYNYYYKMIV